MMALCKLGFIESNAVWFSLLSASRFTGSLTASFIYEYHPSVLPLLFASVCVLEAGAIS